MVQVEKSAQCVCLSVRSILLNEMISDLDNWHATHASSPGPVFGYGCKLCRDIYLAVCQVFSAKIRTCDLEC